jgi:hypothetical protein
MTDDSQPIQDPWLCAPQLPRVYLFGNVNYSVLSKIKVDNGLFSYENTQIKE